MSEQCEHDWVTVNEFEGDPLLECRKCHKTLELDEVIGIIASRDAWKADAERLADEWVRWDGNNDRCAYCNFVQYQYDIDDIRHAPDCPVELHRQLMARIEEK